jgi:predicted HD phosphohydrolase
MDTGWRDFCCFGLGPEWFELTSQASANPWTLQYSAPHASTQMPFGINPRLQDAFGLKAFHQVVAHPNSRFQDSMRSIFSARRFKEKLERCSELFQRLR